MADTIREKNLASAFKCSQHSAAAVVGDIGCKLRTLKMCCSARRQRNIMMQLLGARASNRSRIKFNAQQHVFSMVFKMSVRDTAYKNNQH